MKKTAYLLIGVALMLSAIGCTTVETTTKKSDGSILGVNEVLEQGMEAVDRATNETVKEESVTIIEQEPATESALQSEVSSPTANEESVDVDLTKLSSTMVYSEVYNMTTAPDGYIGKTVKMTGPFAVYHDEAADHYYFACVIRDATACCAQGIEFVLEGDFAYPDDYPAVGEDISVIGVFDTYQEGQYTYCTLRHAKLL